VFNFSLFDSDSLSSGVNYTAYASVNDQASSASVAQNGEFYLNSTAANNFSQSELDTINAQIETTNSLV